MTIEMKKVWFDGEKVVTQNIPESDIYKRHWDIASCKAYAEQLRDKNRANTAEHAAEAIEYLLALAQPKEQEPVAWMMPDGKTVDKWALQFYGGQVGKPLYTTPPQRKPLTNGEIYTAYIEAANQTLRPQDERIALAFARAIEAAHNIKE